MDLTKEEKEKLEQAKQAFNVRLLSKKQVEFILGRNLTDKTWHAYTKSQKKKA